MAVKMKTRVNKQQQRSRLQKDLCSVAHLCKDKNMQNNPTAYTSRTVATFESKKRNAFLWEDIKGNFKGVCDTYFLRCLIYYCQYFFVQVNEILHDNKRKTFLNSFCLKGQASLACD